MTLPDVRPALKIVLPLPPNRANDRSHWRKVHAEKAAYYNAAWLCVFQQTRAIQRGASEATRVVVTATLYVHSTMDDDNAVARLKWPLDVLQMNRLVYRDKRPWCALSGIPEQFIDRKSPRVELTLEPVA